MIHLLRAADYKSMPWKNGGGATTEIAVSPEGAGLDAFDWRVSMARVESDGPFSNFPGVDRVLTMLDGKGIILSVDGRIPIGLLNTSDPLHFPGDVPTSCRLIDGPVTDLNVMVRRGSFACDLYRIAIDAEHPVMIAGDAALVFCSRGAALVASAAQEIRLARMDCALVEGNALPLSVRPEGTSELIVAKLGRIIAAEQ